MSYKFGFNISSVPNTPAGVGIYTLHLAQSLIKLVNQSNDRLFIFGRSNQKNLKAIQNSEFIDCGRLPTAKRLLWEQTTLPKLTKRHNIDLFHAPNYSIPLRASCKKVCTIHDLTCYLFPRRRKMIHGWYFRKMIHYSVRHADAIITVSDNTRKDIEKVFKKKFSHIQTVYQGVTMPQAHTPLNETDYGQQLRTPYFLFVSTIEPSKNVERLIRVFSDFVKEYRNFHLYVAGKPGWGYKRIIQIIHEPETGNNIHYLGYQTNEQLANLYANAFAFIYPSLYEGFGIPPLEAMASGTPVLCSYTSSLPEVIGDAALTFNPYNDNEILRAMQTIVENEPVRNSLINKGKQQIRKFSWERSAKETLQIYLSLLE
jgi:glycosyltransferase involved in cell wall biosynthesis